MSIRSGLLIGLYFLSGFLLITASFQKELAEDDDFPVLEGPYLGQKPPGKIPELFAPSILFSENPIHGQIAFYPDDAEPFSSGAIYPGESFSYTFFIPGSYELVSLPNEKNGMLGRIVVKD